MKRAKPGERIGMTQVFCWKAGRRVWANNPGPKTRGMDSGEDPRCTYCGDRHPTGAGPA